MLSMRSLGLFTIFLPSKATGSTSSRRWGIPPELEGLVLTPEVVAVEPEFSEKGEHPQLHRQFA